MFNDEVKNKPDPEIYLLTAKRLNILPEDCLVIEDNENGITAAKNAGCNVMIVNNVSDVNYENIKLHITNLEKK